MNHLANRPSVGTVRCIELGFAQAADQGAQSSWELLDRDDVPIARRAVERRRHALEPSHRITKLLEVGHSHLLLVESRREASIMLRASFTFAAVLSFMILMQPPHGLHSLAQQPPGTGGGRGGQPAGGPTASIADRTSGMQKIDGYFPLYWDERTGSLFLEVPRFDTEFLMNTGLA